MSLVWHVGADKKAAQGLFLVRLFFVDAIS